MKRSSALSALHNGSFRKPKYFAFFVVVVVAVVFASILLERILRYQPGLKKANFRNF